MSFFHKVLISWVILLFFIIHCRQFIRTLNLSIQFNCAVIFQPFKFSHMRPYLRYYLLLPWHLLQEIRLISEIFIVHEHMTTKKCVGSSFWFQRCVTCASFTIHNIRFPKVLRCWSPQVLRHRICIRAAAFLPLRQR